VITDDQIRELRAAALQWPQNMLLAEYCRKALAGDADARALVERVLNGETP